jgi:hypothetical protein
MKKLLKKWLVMVVLPTTILSYSNANVLHSNDQTKKGTVVSIDSVKEGSLFIIKDSNGQILYNERIEQTGTFSKGFDLSKLPEATYCFEVEGQNEITIIPFIVKSDTIEFNKEYKLVKPNVAVSEERVFISKTSADEQTWEIEVYYDDGYDLAHREKLKDTKSIKRIYDFSTSKKGNYTIVFTSEGREFKNNIEF